MDLKYMDLAFEEAEKAFNLDEVPIGAVIVKNNTVISKKFNLKESKKCCLYHAEILCIKEASKKLKNWRLDGCDIYITLDPCPMCASAIKQARISNVYSACPNLYKNNSDIIKEIFDSDATSKQVNFVTNLDVDKSKNILNNFFKLKRK